MASHIFLFPFFFLLAIANSLPPNETHGFPLCLDEERSALIQFKQSFVIDCAQSSKPPFGWIDVPTWTVKPAFSSIPTYPKAISWGSHHAINCCGWDGVECDKDTGHVVGLDLSSSCLFGRFPTNSSLFRLVHLQRLNLANNHFNFSLIPIGFGHLSRLRSLNLSYSVFSGQIPPDFMKLSRLSSLDLSYNVDPFVAEKPLLQLHSPYLESLLSNMTGLEALALDMVDVSSTVPLVLTNLTSLRSISLSYCGLHGKLPPAIFHLSNLKTITISHNDNLKGSLPEFTSNTPLEILDVSSTSFSGHIPASIGNLGFLGMLNLQACHLMGSLPASLGNLTNLEILQLHNNMFMGQIPSSFANLSRLMAFIPQDNNITIGSEVFSWLPKLNRLAYLGFGMTNMQGLIPTVLANLTELKYLSLRFNQLSGQIPSWIGNLTHLRIFDVAHNLLHGPLPHSISNLVNLVMLTACSNNNLFVDFDIVLKLRNAQVVCLSKANVKLPTDVITNSSATPGPKFQVLELNSCNLIGFPQFLHVQDELEVLHLKDNNISGHIPLWLLNNNKETLRVLALSNNSIIGFEKPQAWFEHSSLKAVFLNDNLLMGPLLFPSAAIEIYFASNNKLGGHLPTHICNLSSLMYLDVSNNSIGGKLPQCLGDLGGSLVAVNIRGNNFHGPIPTTYSKSCKLKMINLSENRLVGRLPRSMANCKQLVVLDMGMNHINDSFPSWLGSLPALEVLVMRRNNFYGPIASPTFNLEFSRLRVIDLSHNFHVGSLPFENIQNWHAMKSVGDQGHPTPYETSITSSATVNWGGLNTYGLTKYYKYSITMINKGNEMLFPRVLNVFRAIDLSSNRFEGRIPSSIGDLTGLQALNLSNNNIEGSIPSPIGNIKDLESLDLSWNNISGEIPQQLRGVTSLEVFDVSHNKLTGPIPQGNQFNTFDISSFEGNAGLCGNPLPNSCNNVDEAGQFPQPSTSQEDEEKSDELVKWIIISLGYASGAIVGFVIGKLICDSKHEWFLHKFGSLL